MYPAATIAAKNDVFMLKSNFWALRRHGAIEGFCDAT
jgi:hypothetical protein